ncbi:MAG: hypothetical protein ACP5KE_06590 [Candidatus Methanodesulfokora sp.]
MKKYVVVLLLLLLLVLPAKAEERKDIIEVEPLRMYFQVGDVIFIHVKWNGTDYRYAIALGPYLKLKQYRFTAPEVTRVTKDDPDQYWVVEVAGEGNGTQTPTWFEVGIFNTTTGQLERRFHRDIIILDTAVLTGDYMKKVQEIQNLTNQINALKLENVRKADLISQMEKEMLSYKRAAEIARRFIRYSDYVKIQNVTITGLPGTVSLTVPLPSYYDPAIDQWVTVSTADLLIKDFKVYVKVPWWVRRNGTNVTYVYVPIERIMNPNDLENVFLWNEWFNAEEAKSKQSFKTLYQYSWVVPLGFAGAVIGALLTLRFIWLRWFKRTWRKAEERGIAPPA